MQQAHVGKALYHWEAFMVIDKNEVLRYLGYKGQKIDINLKNLLEESINELDMICKEKYISDIFDMERQADYIAVTDTTLCLHGKDIKKHLKHSEKCVLMAATLGLEVDKHIAMYSRTHLTKGIILDACASAAVEGLCDCAKQEIKKQAKSMGYELTSRYSPGYGDFSICVQKDILEILKAYKRIGLTVNENHIMIPRKSVTAVIGLKKGKCAQKKDKCSRCDNYDCLYRKSGDNDEC